MQQKEIYLAPQMFCNFCNSFLLLQVQQNLWQAYYNALLHTATKATA